MKSFSLEREGRVQEKCFSKMSPAEREIVGKLFEADLESGHGYSDPIQLALSWPSREIVDLFVNKYGLDPTIDWREIAISFMNSYNASTRGREKGTKREIPITIDKVLAHLPEQLGLKKTTHKRILKRRAATERQIKTIVSSRARVTFRDLGLSDDFSRNWSK